MFLSRTLLKFTSVKEMLFANVFIDIYMRIYTLHHPNRYFLPVKDMVGF